MNVYCKPQLDASLVAKSSRNAAPPQIQGMEFAPWYGIDVDEVALNDGCGCGQIERACGQLRIYAFLVPDLSDMCSQVHCCDDGTTTNDGFNTCMTTAFENDDVTVPNFESIIPGGIPDLGGKADDSNKAIESPSTTDEDMSMRLIL